MTVMGEAIEWLMWAHERNVDRLRELGWEVEAQTLCHHHHWAVLMVWRGQGDPKEGQNAR